MAGVTGGNGSGGSNCRENSHATAQLEEQNLWRILA